MLQKIIRAIKEELIHKWILQLYGAEVYLQFKDLTPNQMTNKKRIYITEEMVLAVKRGETPEVIPASEAPFIIHAQDIDGKGFYVEYSKVTPTK